MDTLNWMIQCIHPTKLKEIFTIFGNLWECRFSIDFFPMEPLAYFLTHSCTAEFPPSAPMKCQSSARTTQFRPFWKGYGTLPVEVGTIPNPFQKGMERCQFLLAAFRTLFKRVRNAANFYWQHSVPFSKGYGTLPIFTGSIPYPFQKSTECCQ